MVEIGQLGLVWTEEFTCLEDAIRYFKIQDLIRGIRELASYRDYPSHIKVYNISTYQQIHDFFIEVGISEFIEIVEQMPDYSIWWTGEGERHIFTVFQFDRKILINNLKKLGLDVLDENKVKAFLVAQQV
jgi:hypothetical protein